MGFLFFTSFTRSLILMKFDQKVVHSLFTGCIPCRLRTLTLSSNHALYSLSCWRLSSKFILYTGRTPCSLFFLLDFVLVPCGVFHITEVYLLVFYMPGVFLAVSISVGVCPQIMWCTPCYRGISSCSNLCGQFIIRLLASTLFYFIFLLIFSLFFRTSTTISIPLKYYYKYTTYTSYYA